MNNYILYSVLQYKHSLILGESLNVGVLFSFPDENKLYFVSGNVQRVKSIYPTFDSSIFGILSKGISRKLILPSNDNIFVEKVIYDISTKDSLKDYIDKFILAEDSTSLQFSEVFTAVNSFETTKKGIEELSRLLLPEGDLKRDNTRHNDNYLQRKFLDNLVQRNINLEHRIKRNVPIIVKGADINFEVAWDNRTTHLVKPISFDLKEGRDIQNKSVTNFGYLDLLKDYANSNNYTFDLLIAKPQDESLIRYYENAIEILSKSSAPKEIITEDRLTEYSDHAAEELHKQDL